MIWALFEIIIPLLVTFILGLIMGWLLWRWRRRHITAGEWDKHTAAATVATENLESFRIKHDEIAQENSHLSATMKKMGDNLDSRKVEIEKEVTKAADLRAQLQETKSSIVNLQAQVSNTAESDSELTRLRGRNTELVSQLDDANTRIEELEKSELQAAELEKSLNAANEKLAAAEQYKLRAQDLENQLNTTTMKLGDFDKTQSEVMSLQSQLADANSKVGESEKATEKRVGQLEAQLRAANATLSTSEKLVSELELQLKQANEKGDEAEKLKTQTADLARQVSHGQAQGDELAKSKARVAELEAKTLELGKQAEQSNAKLAELEKLHTENSKLTNQLTEARSNASDLQQKEATNNAAGGEQHRARILDLERQLDACRKRSEKLEQAQQNAGAQSTSEVHGLHSNNSSVDTQSFKADIADRDRKIADLERRLAEARDTQQVQDTTSTVVRTTGGWQDTGSWQKGVTKLGTPGCDHKDDLKVISGIGGKMEKLLNSFDIQSWEQLAALTEEEVQKVDDALAEFPGRIKRDEWVLQAQEIMANGHVPLDKKAKKPKKQPSAKPANSDWRSGTTQFGTPGSSHRDDLKAINGIGPVLEKTLNEFGVQSWEQLAELSAEDVDKVDQAIAFPGRIAREEWVAQAKALVERYPDRSERP